MSLDQKIEAAASVIGSVFAENSADACVTCSFQTECMVLVDLVIAHQPNIPVLFLETGYHFPETYAYRDQMTERLHLNLVNLASKQTVAEQESQFGILNQTAPDRCCGMRKVEPLFRGLRRLRRLVHSTASRTIADSRQSATGRSFSSAYRKAIVEGEPACGLDKRGRLGLFEAARHSGSSALSTGLHQHRLRSLHRASVRSREHAFGSMGRQEAGMRHPYFQRVRPWKSSSAS